MSGEYLGSRLTVGIDGSFGILRYAFLAMATSSGTPGSDIAGQSAPYSLTEDMLRRGFRRACNSDYADIALKAQPADGSVLCRASADGRVSVWFDDKLAWSERFDTKDEETACWLQAARTREITLISGDYLLISGADVHPTAAADKRTLMMAKIPTVWT
ncbi:hypothetical protein QE394_001791 [Arthrobacter sp. SORGH_AS 212]|jgi:hypothetical protein|uniref:hypothetical protein n=1 Tax=Pseudarthrobacter sp. SORGH_AS 212 TaxID=3041777 RepID=UPI0027838236|nr:hypothetical protein [Arthrobacter sp. SORGH_AS_0212]